MPDFASRLRKHREQLGLSLQTLAQMCGIGTQDQAAYESGVLKPNRRYLYALAEAGLDLGYLTTGEPSLQLPEGMDRGAFVFLENYRHCSPEAQADIFLTLMIAAAPSQARQAQEAARMRREHPREAANDSGFAPP